MDHADKDAKQTLLRPAGVDSPADLLRWIESLTELNRQLSAIRDYLRDDVDRYRAALEERVSQQAAEHQDWERKLEESARLYQDRLQRLQRMLHQSQRDASAFERRLARAAARAVQSASPANRGVRQLLLDAGLPLSGLVGHPLRFARSAARLRHREYRVRVSELARSGIFDPAYYRDSVKAGPRVDLVARFILAGDAQGESPHPLFDPVWYREHNPDLPADAPALLHYLRSGGREGRSPHPLFDTRHYLAQWPEGIEAPTPLSHFLAVGFLGAASPHPLFDIGYYVGQRPDAFGVNPLLHYLSIGAAELADPHPLFSTRFYVETNPGIGGRNPLDHFVRCGAAEGRAPHPLFDVGFYWRQRPDVRASGVNALVHFMEFGADEGTDPHPLFDTRFYLEQAGGAGFGVNPLVHFVLRGWREGRDPSSGFSVRDHVARHPEVAAGQNPLEHFLQLQRAGRSEGAFRASD